MPDREITIKALQVIADPKMDYPKEMPTEYMSVGGFPLYKKLARDALALLREQEPVKPKEYMSRVNRTEYLCGACDSGILYGDKFCRHCGREAKWE